MTYIIAQTFGLLTAVCCFIGPYFKKKWQMLVIYIIANLFSIANLFFLGEIGSAIITNLIAIVQMIFSFWHIQKNTNISLWENVIFSIMYITLGMVGYTKFIDILPIIGAEFLMISIFQKDEQKTRLYCLYNSIVWIIYCVLIGSSAVVAQLVSFCSVASALFKYRKKM